MNPAPAGNSRSMPHKHATILLVLIALSVVLGGLAGWIAGPEMARVAWIGKLFLDALKMLVVPLLFAAVVTGVAPWGTCGGSGGWAASRSSISS